MSHATHNIHTSHRDPSNGTSHSPTLPRKPAMKSRPSNGVPIRRKSHADAEQDAHEMANKYHESAFTGSRNHEKNHSHAHKIKEGSVKEAYSKVESSNQHSSSAQPAPKQAPKPQPHQAPHHTPSTSTPPDTQEQPGSSHTQTNQQESSSHKQHEHSKSVPISSQTTSTESVASAPNVSPSPSQEQEQHQQQHHQDERANTSSKSTDSAAAPSHGRARARARSPHTQAKSACSPCLCPPESMPPLHPKRILLPHLEPLSETLKSSQVADPHTLKALFPNLKKGWTKLLSKLLEMGMASEGNSVEVYSCGDASFAAQFKAIDAAKNRVYLETFVLTMDKLGTKLVEKLYQAAERGCKVILMYDGGGSLGFGGLNEKDPLLTQLREHPNVTVVVFNPLFRIWSRKPGQELWNRNHRKILIADDIGFGGGMNSTAQYAGPKLGVNQFRDTHMRIEGPAVEHLTQVFHESVREALSRSEWRTVMSEIRAAVPSDRQVLHYLTRSGPSLVRSDSLKIISQARTEWNQYSPYIFQRVKQITHALTSTTRNVIHDVTKQAKTLWNTWKWSSSTKSAMDKTKKQMHDVKETIHDVKEQHEVLPPWDSDSDGEESDSDWGSDWDTQDSPTSQVAPTEQASETTDKTSTNPPISPIIPAPTPLSPSAPPVATTTQHHNVFVQIFRSNAIRNVIAIQRSVLETIKHSQTQILITNPFFLPRPRIARALLRAARRGVRITILTQGISDTPWMRWAAIYIYHRFLQHPNIDIWEYQDRILHAKTMTIDGIWSTVGSFNLDYLSSRKLLELNIGIVDHDTSCTLQQQFQCDLQYSKQVTLDSLQKRSWYIKLGHWCAYHIGYFIQHVID